MNPDREVVLWPTRENYARFHELCDDDTPATFDEFLTLATQRLLLLETTLQISLDKLNFDPDAMAQWCRANFGKVDSHTRKLYAVFLATAN